MAGKRFPGEVETILKKTDRQYDAFRRSTPDIGGKKNMQFKDLDFLIAFFSFYEACDRRIGIPELDEFAYKIVVKPSETAGRFIGWNSPLMAKMAAKQYTGYKKKIDAHIARGEWGICMIKRYRSASFSWVLAQRTRSGSGACFSEACVFRGI